MTRSVGVLALFFVACGTVRTPFSSGPDEHVGEIACHAVLLPAKGAPRAFFLCGGQRAACEASRRDQIAKGYAVSDCAIHPHAACMPTDDGQLCLGSLAECRDFAKAASRHPDGCTSYVSERGEQAGAFAGLYESSLGDVAVLRAGSAIELRYAAGSMRCTLAGTSATCTWSEGDKKGRAKLAQQVDGSWSGTRGDGESDTGLGALSFRRKR